MRNPHRWRWMGLRGRFVVFVVTGVGGVSMALALFGYLVGSRNLLATRKAEISALARLHAVEMGRRLALVEGPARHLAATLEEIDWPRPDKLVTLLKTHVAKSPRLYGMALAFAPYAYKKGVRRYAPYVFRSPKGLKAVRVDGPAYDYPHQDWYLLPVLLKRPLWGEPFFDYGGGEAVMTTFSVPVIRGGRVLAVTTADVSLKKLGQQVRRLAVGKTGYAFLMTRLGVFLAAPKGTWVMRQSIFSLAEARRRPDLRKLGRRMIRRQSGVERIRDWYHDRAAWLAYATVPGAGWIFGVVMPEAEVLVPVRALARRQFLLALAGVITMVIIVWLLVVGLTRPIRRLTAGARRMASGDLSVRVGDIRPGDEIGELAGAFNVMGNQLTENLERIKKETAARQAVESEIRIARQIQESLLPRTFPPFPLRTEFNLFGHNLAAREVAGDFYDYFFVDDDHLVLVIADVSGKGVAAAMFMAVTRTLFRNICVSAGDPAVALGQANRVLCQDNEASMFVTVFLAYYQVSTGLLTYGNAGHNEVIMLRADGGVDCFGVLGDVPLGIIEDRRFKSTTTRLGPGDTLIFYTDGITEALSPDGEFFGEERLVDLARSLRRESVNVCCRRIIDAAMDFQQGDHFDDITMMVLRREDGVGAERPDESTDRIAVEAALDDLPKLTEFVAQKAEAAGFESRQALKIQLAVEEIFTNIMHYAYPDGRGQVALSCGQTADGDLTIEIVDQGAPFNPLEAEEPDVTAGLDERPVGGLGIFLTRKLVDKMEYRRQGDKNVLRLIISKGVP